MPGESSLPDLNALMLQAMRAVQQGPAGGKMPVIGIPDVNGFNLSAQGFVAATFKPASQGRQTLADKLFAAIQNTGDGFLKSLVNTGIQPAPTQDTGIQVPDFGNSGPLPAWLEAVEIRLR